MRRLYHKIYLTIIVEPAAGGHRGRRHLARSDGKPRPPARLSRWRASWRPPSCRRPTRRARFISRRSSASRNGSAPIWRCIDASLALLARAGAPASAAARAGRLDLRPAWAGLGLPPAGRPRARRPRAGAAPPSCRRPGGVSRRDRAGGGGVRLSGRARADPPPGTPADRRRDARRRRPVRAGARSRAATRWRGSPRASTARPPASRSW